MLLRKLSSFRAAAALAVLLKPLPRSIDWR
jgi:hypothetical protein